jgi:hypothetical protein
MKKKKDPSIYEPRVGSIKDIECFEIDLTNMSQKFLAAYLTRADLHVPFLSMNDEHMQEAARKSVELAHALMIEIQECVEAYGDNE